jgi:arabinose-5-phosphate isomerase
LLLHIGDIMHRGDEIPQVTEDATLAEALMEMSKKGMGMTAIVDRAGRVAGIYTDGDLRRTLDRGIDIRHSRVSEVMTRGCITASADLLAAEALKIMEEKKINGLLLLDSEKILIGALNMHDLLRAGVM